MHPSKRKGDKAELEVQAILRDLLGVPARRKLGAGRRDDMGDIDGVPDTVISVVNWQNVAKAVRDKPPETEEQRKRTSPGPPPGWEKTPHDEWGATFAATFVRLRGGDYRVVLTPEQWATYWREAVA